MTFATMCDVAITPEAFVCDQHWPGDINMVAYWKINTRLSPYVCTSNPEFQSTFKTALYGDNREGIYL